MEEEGKVAIIMAFNYAVCHGLYHQFPATIADIYLSYSWARHIGCCKILIITDNTEKIITKQIRDLVVEGEISSEIENFYSDHLNIRHYIDISTFEKDVKTVCINAKRVLFYYSGHGTAGDLILPHYNHNAGYIKSVGVQRVSIDNILKPIIYPTVPTSQIFIILDSCESSNAYLPFRWEIDRFLFMGSRVYGVYGGRKIISISSSTIGSYASHDGSHFTTHLFKIFKQGSTISIKSLIDELNNINIGDVSLRVSHPNIKFIPLWLFSRTMSNIEYNYDCQSFIIEKG